MKTKTYYLYLFLLISFNVNAQQAETQQQLRTNISVHDPVMFQQDGIYYVFCTGNGIANWSSKDMINWKQEKPVFATAPQWAKDSIKGFRGNSLWAPDISYNKKTKLYYLFYSASAFGKNTSCIGLATNKTLHTNDPDYLWVDHGMVIQSIPGKTNWNAIDPNLVTDKSGTDFLVFHGYDAKDNARPKLRIERMTWDKEKWPVIKVEYPFMVKPGT